MREIDEITEGEKAGASAVFGAIYIAIIAVIMLLGVWQSGKIGLLAPDWLHMLITEHQWK